MWKVRWSFHLVHKTQPKLYQCQFVMLSSFKFIKNLTWSPWKKLILNEGENGKKIISENLSEWKKRVMKIFFFCQDACAMAWKLKFYSCSRYMRTETERNETAKKFCTTSQARWERGEVEMNWNVEKNKKEKKNSSFSQSSSSSSHKK